MVYPESTARKATPDAGYELNMNTGRSMRFHLSLSPGDGEPSTGTASTARSSAATGGVVRPPPHRLFAAMPKAMLLGLLIESLRWHERAGVAREDDAVLNACRALRYAAEDLVVEGGGR